MREGHCERDMSNLQFKVDAFKEEGFMRRWPRFDLLLKAASELKDGVLSDLLLCLVLA